VIRLMGPDAPALMAQVFRGKRSGHPARAIGRLHYGHLVKGDDTLDEVLVAAIDEHTVDINCHGGVVAVERVMAELQRLGAARVRADAAPALGLDAVQREAAAAIPGARSRPAVRMLLEQYRGELSRAVRAAADMPPRRAAAALAPLRFGARLGMALCTPGRIVIVGSPNAGKSTLFNLLLGQSRAIVTHIPGTTRDFISDTAVIRGVPFELVDTAGLRDSGHIIEREGVRLSHEQIGAADVVLLIFDAARSPSAEDERILASVGDAPAHLIVVANKIDLLDGGPPTGAIRPDICISAETGAGINDLEAAIVRASVGDQTYAGGPMVFTRRQFELVGAAHAAAERSDQGFRKLLHPMTVPPQG